MDAIGSLAGGVAHDFNNILTAFIGYGTIVKMKMQPGDPLLPSIDAILSSSERAAQLTKRLLAFGRKQVINPVPVDLNRLDRNVEAILKRLIGEDVDSTTRLSDTPPIVTANAGALAISTGKFEMGDDFFRAYGFGKTGMFALIEVSDTGRRSEYSCRSAESAKPYSSSKTTKSSGT